MASAQKIIIGNWKMNPQSLEDARRIFVSISKSLRASKKTNVIICPASLHSIELGKLAVKHHSSISLGVQNFFGEEQGSYTGELSIDMVRDAGATYAIIGHSERRKLGETDEVINKKVKLALKKKITPIICIGETVRDEEGEYYQMIRMQLEKAISGISKSDLAKIIIAYEPVWAIGALAAMEPHGVHEMKIFIKKTLFDMYKIREIVTPIIYGGAVDPQNVHGLLSVGLADGFLIGRQSLEPKSFLEIISIVQAQ